MNEAGDVREQEKTGETRPPRGAARRRPIHNHPFEVRRRAVQLYLEEGFPLQQVARELQVGQSTLSKWAKLYREQGAAALQNKSAAATRRPPKVAAAVKEKIVALKSAHPTFGVKKISQFLRRMCFLSASPETVRRTLHARQLIQKAKHKPRHHPSQPQSFERSTSNQLWQSDIFTFRVGGQNAYLIGFLDDYSRYVVGLDLFRSQRAEQVVEVYRTAVGEYGVPQEMLTDNGRQYTSWRGKTRFEFELQKDRVHHIKSRPHHPMTLGKIERFWKTIWEEFLERAKFDSFEEARERIRFWVKYYNHQRPHQALGGLCPADRFFEIARELRQVIEKGVQENALELALRGQPRPPFYMVGRLGEQSVVIRAEKGQVQMLIDGQAAAHNQTLTQQLRGGNHDQRTETAQATTESQCPPASASGAGGLDGTTAVVPGVPGTGDQCCAAGPLGGAGTGGDAQGPGAANPLHPEARVGLEREVGTTAGTPSPAGAEQEGPQGKAVGQTAGTEVTAATATHPVAWERLAHETQAINETRAGAGTPTSGADRAGAERLAQRPGSGPPTGNLAPDLLQVGTARPAGDGRGAEQPQQRPPFTTDQPGEGSTEATEHATAAPTPSVGAGQANPSAGGPA